MPQSLQSRSLPLNRGEVEEFVTWDEGEMCSVPRVQRMGRWQAGVGKHTITAMRSSHDPFLSHAIILPNKRASKSNFVS